MSLADALTESKRFRPGKTCSCKQMLDILANQPAELEAFEALMSDYRRDATSIAALVKEHTGWPLGSQSVQRHRRGACTCR
jgi:hypothetical protein